MLFEFLVVDVASSSIILGHPTPEMLQAIFNLGLQEVTFKLGQAEVKVSSELHRSQDRLDGSAIDFKDFSFTLALSGLNSLPPIT